MYGKFVRSRILPSTPCTPRGKKIYTSVYCTAVCAAYIQASSVMHFFVWMGVPYRHHNVSKTVKVMRYSTGPLIRNTFVRN